MVEFILKKPVGYLINFNSKYKKIVNDDCQRMKTHLFLSHEHDTQGGCKILEAQNKVISLFIINQIQKQESSDINISGSTTDGFFKMYSNAKTWPYLLSKLCNLDYNCEVVNGGVGGYSSDQELIKYLLYSENFNKFDYVISLNGINELNLDRRLNIKQKEYPYHSQIQF